MVKDILDNRRHGQVARTDVHQAAPKPLDVWGEMVNLRLPGILFAAGLFWTVPFFSINRGTRMRRRALGLPPPGSGSLGPGLVVAVAVATAGFLLVPQLILAAPVEPVMGTVQKIFYFHVPCSSMMFLSTFVAAGGSVAFLFKGSERGDRLAHAAVEIAVLFGVFTLVTGPLWGRKAWGVWWQWDARLTNALLLFLILVAYLLARRYGGEGARKLAAALALFAAIDVPLVYKSVDIWRTLHPKTTVVRTLDPRMRPAFWASFALITLVWGILLIMRTRFGHLQASLADLEVALDDHLEDRR